MLIKVKTMSDEIIVDSAKIMTQEQVNMSKELGIEIVEDKKIHKGKGKPKSEAWKKAHSEAMKNAHAKKKNEQNI